MSELFHVREWHPDRLFEGISRTKFLAANQQEQDDRYANLWQGLCSESDAAALKHEIFRRNILETDDAKRYIDLWSRDEQRHAEGFVLLLELLCGIPSDVTKDRLRSRGHDLSLINKHIVDEFTLLTLIAFDEIATCRGYSRDREFYAGLGHEAFLTWIKATIADEMTHATNAVRVIHKHHADRLGELDAVLDGWTESATTHHEYRGTFLMDSLELGYFRDDFPDFRQSLNQMFQNPAVLDKAAGKTVAF